MNWCEEKLTPLENEISALDKQVRDLKSSIRRERNAQIRINLMSEYQSQSKTLDIKRKDYRREKENIDKLMDSKYIDLSKSLSYEVNLIEVFTLKWEIA